MASFDSIIQMLSNIANDLDVLLTDLCHKHPCQSSTGGSEGGGETGSDNAPGVDDGEHGTLNALTQHSGDTLGKDSFLSSGEAASRRLGDTTGSSQSLISSSSGNLSEDSGHDERTQGTTSPLVFDPNHFGAKARNVDHLATKTTAVTMTPHSTVCSRDNDSQSSGDLRPISLVERLAKTHSIWLLSQMSRAGAVHLLKDRATGVFIIRKSSQPNSLALSVQNRMTDRANVDHYLIEASSYGMRLQGSAHFFHSIPSLIAHYIENLDELPYCLTLPAAIFQARSSRELASLAMLGQDFWLSPVSRKARTPSPACYYGGGSLHKSCSEPIDIRQPLQLHSSAAARPATPPRPYTSNTPPFHPLHHHSLHHNHLHLHHHHHNVAVVAPSSSHSVSDFSDFMTSQQVQEEQEAVFKQQQQQHQQQQPQQQFSGGSRTPVVAGSALPRRVFASAAAAGVGAGVRTGGGGFGPHLLRLKGLNNTPTSTDSSCGEDEGGHGGGGGGVGVGRERGDNPNNSQNLPCIQLVGGDRADSPHSQGGALSDASSQTDFSSLQRHQPEGLPNLYSLTPAELLSLQENNTYFRSSLSDKMSDYEDIWRSSYYDTDSVRNGSVRGGAVGLGGGAGVGGAGFDGESCTATARSDFTKFFAVNGGGGGGGKRDSSAAQPVTVVVSMDGGGHQGAIVNHVATQADECPPIPPKNWETDPNALMVVVEPKLLHPPALGGRLSRLKSSSDSSLATVSSPVYAEPADAVVFRDRHVRPTARGARVRRRSAPSVSSQALPQDHVLPVPPHGASASASKHHQHLPPPSHLPPPPAAEAQNVKLTTVVSRHDALDHPPRGVKKPTVGGGVAAVLAGDRGGHGSGMVSRSQSMRTPQEVARLSKKKPGWQERFNRLKLGTKVLTQSGSPYATSSNIGALQQPQLLDDSLFATETENSSGGPSSAAAISRFPVYQRSRLLHAVNRGSYFSESSTVQDIISCAMPELMVRPIQTQHQHHHYHHQLHLNAGAGAGSNSAASGKQLSEYDNFNPYAPPSAASSHGTVFCTPWEGSMADTLLRSSTSTQLPPAMDLQERVQKWQEANQTFQHQQGHYHQQQQQQQQQQQSQQAYSLQQEQAHRQAYQQQPHPHHQQQYHQQHQQVHHKHHLHQKQQPHQLQQQPALQQSANVVKQAHTVQTMNVVTGNNNNNNSSGAGAIVSSVTMTNAGRAVAALPSKPPTRPHSMYQPQNQVRPHHHHPQLTRSFSNPSQPPQPQLARSHPHLHHHQSQSQQHLGHHHHHHHWQGCQVMVAEESSGVTPDSRIGGLSSNCPDVINCHHIAMDTGDAALSDDEILLQSVHSTQRGPQHKQVAQTPGSKIREYIYKLSQDQSTIFGSTIENFIQCTVDSQERTPHHVMRNVRQFMTGIKNYLVKHGEGELEDLIERERNKLGSNKILNIDALIETTLHMCVLRPLKHHIYRLFVDFHGRNNSLELMSRNIKYARTKTAEEIGIKPGLVPPQSSDMETIKHYLDKMQRAYSPLKKLENLLGATTAIYNCVKVQGKQHVHTRGPASLGADDFLPLLIYVLVHCGLVSAEIEADYMWGLLHPSVLTGEGGYYLTTLSSAVLILKNFQEAHESKTASLEGHLPTLGEVQGFLKIAFPDELRDTILWKTLPVRPNMTTKDVCAMIAHKFKITNPQDYGLLLLCDGEESQLSDNTCPQILKKDKLAAGIECFFAYKRLGVNIAWPSNMKHS